MTRGAGRATDRGTTMPASETRAHRSVRLDGQTFWAVRMQRLQAVTLVVLPSRTRVMGWRLGSHRRRARLRFIPTDWGFQPVIGRLPQISQTRAMVEGFSSHENDRRRAPERPRW